jgi:hypothetical protein
MKSNNLCRACDCPAPMRCDRSAWSDSAGRPMARVGRSEEQWRRIIVFCNKSNDQRRPIATIEWCQPWRTGASHCHRCRSGKALGRAPLRPAVLPRSLVPHVSVASRGSSAMRDRRCRCMYSTLAMLLRLGLAQQCLVQARPARAAVRHAGAERRATEAAQGGVAAAIDLAQGVVDAE